MKHDFDHKCGKKMRGVNLGGWLVLEKWMTPSVFEGLEAVDETTYCVELGEKAGQALKNHWDTFITREDFVWLAGVGINAVRIPVGHWIFGSDYPYHRSYGEVRHPFVQGGIAVLDRAFDWAEQLGLHVVLDLHAAPGCQNGFDNGGIKDVCEWHTQPEYIEHSLDVLERLAERYHSRPALHAIEVLNEPRWDIDTALLKKYNTEAYHRIRKYCQAKDVAVVYHDGFRSFREYTGFLAEPEFNNVVLDIHRYQCFVREDIDTDLRNAAFCHHGLDFSVACVVPHNDGCRDFGLHRASQFRQRELQATIPDQTNGRTARRAEFGAQRCGQPVAESAVACA